MPGYHYSMRRVGTALLLGLLVFGVASARSSSYGGSHHSSSHHGATHSSAHGGSHSGSSYSYSSSGAPKIHSGSAHAPKHSSSYASIGHHSGHHGGSKKAIGVPRDSHGKIKRSAKAKDEFRKGHPCPANGKTRGACPGYVIDHVQALKHGGQDAAGNMQWQTTEAAKAKDKVE
jgi:hypothetical protein